MKKFILVITNIFLLSFYVNAQCPVGGILYHNCAGSPYGGCDAGCQIGVCTGTQITKNCGASSGNGIQQVMSVTITAPSSSCLMTVTGSFKPNPDGSIGSCPDAGMDGEDVLKVGNNANVTGSSNATRTSTYAGIAGESITVGGSSNRRDEVITYTINCTGTCNVAAPVTLLYINCKTTDSGVILDWATSNEINNDHFSIEYSNNGIDFKEIMIVKGNGTSTAMNTYIAEVNDRFIGTTYYRLKQYDIDGKVTTYSQIFSATNNPDDDYFITQSENEVYLNVNAFHESSFEISVYTVIGNTLVGNRKADLQLGMNQIPLESHYASGMYICHITLDNKIYSRKFIIY